MFLVARIPLNPQMASKRSAIDRSSAFLHLEIENPDRFLAAKLFWYKTHLSAVDIPVGVRSRANHPHTSGIGGGSSAEQLGQGRRTNCSSDLDYEGRGRECDLLLLSSTAAVEARAGRRIRATPLYSGFGDGMPPSAFQRAIVL